MVGQQLARLVPSDEYLEHHATIEIKEQDRSGRPAKERPFEPTASLDLCHQIDLLAIIKRRNDNGTTIVTVMHDLNLAALFAKRIVALAKGAVAGDGAPVSTINDALLSRVFGITNAVNRVPSGLPFVLPHQAKKAERAKHSP